MHNARPHDDVSRDVESDQIYKHSTPFRFDVILIGHMKSAVARQNKRVLNFHN